MLDFIYAQINDDLTKEEKRQQALKIAAAREEMIKDMVNHNKRILKQKEKAFEEFVENYEPEYEEEEEEEEEEKLINNITEIIGEEEVMEKVRFTYQHDLERGILIPQEEPVLVEN